MRQNIADNPTFKQFIFKYYPEELPQPPFNPSMVEWFGDDKIAPRYGLISNTSTLEQAMYALYNYWAELGMVPVVAFATPYTDANEFKMCSARTKELAVILGGYRMYYCCDARPSHFYPLLEDIELWLETTYITT